MTYLLQDLDDATRTHGTATLADGEGETLFHGDRLAQGHGHLGVVTRHDHLGARGQLDGAGDVGRAEVELRTVVREEGLVTAALFLGEHVDRGLEVRVGRDGAGLAQHLAALDLFLLGTTQQRAEVVAGLSLVEELAEHLDAGHDGLGRRAKAHDLDFVADLHDALLDLAGDDGATAGDGHDVLDGHEERLLGRAHGLGDERVNGVHELHDLVARGFVALEGLQRGDADNRGVVAGEAVAGQQLTDLHLDELDELFVVDLVDLVERDHDVGHADLAREQYVLAGLGHGTVGRRDDEDGPVDLGGAGDHVLDVVGVAGHVHVGVVTFGRLVLNVGNGDRDAALLLFGRLVDLVEGREGGSRQAGGEDLGDGRGEGRLVLNVGNGDRDAALLLFGRLVDLVEGREGGSRQAGGEDLGDGRGEGGLAVVDVAHRANVYVRLSALELLFCHCRG